MLWSCVVWDGGDEPVSKFLKRLDVGGVLGEVSCGVVGNPASLEVALGQRCESKPIRPEPGEFLLLRLARGRDEDGVLLQSREIELRAVSASAHKGAGTLECECELGVGWIVPGGDVAFDGAPATRLSRDDEAGSVGGLHPSAQRLFHEGAVWFYSAHHAHAFPRHFSIGSGVAGEPTEHPDVAGTGVDVRRRKASAERTFAWLEVWTQTSSNPSPIGPPPASLLLPVSWGRVVEVGGT